MPQSPPVSDRLFLDCALLGLRGVSGAALARLAAAGRPGADARRARPAELVAAAASAGGVALPPCWSAPSRSEVESLARRLSAAGVSIGWPADPEFPLRLALSGSARPAWLLRRGRFPGESEPACAVVGSRGTPPSLCRAAFRLGRALSAGGVVVVSGLARGADQAAHAGAVSGPGAGTLSVPSRGLLAAPLPAGAEWSFAGVGRPDDPFSAGLAVRRNSVIAALGGAVVLVASGLRGGSAHAVRYALREGLPLFCFEAGAETPPGNAALLRSGLAEPLPVSDSPARWLRAFLAARRAVTSRVAQPELFDDAA